MNYTYTIKKLPKSELEITVTVPADELKPFIEKAVNALSQETKLAGFRPGHVPYDVLKNKLGEMKIYEEAAGLAVEKSYLEIALTEKIEPLGSPKVEFIKLAPDNEFIYKAVVTLIPEVKLGDIKSVKIKEKPIKITDEQVNKVIAELQEIRAKETAEDKAAEKGDKVEIDLDLFQDNVPLEGGAQKKYPLIIGSNMFIPGFEDNLQGLKKDETKEFELTFPKEYHNKSLAGKPAKFKVKVLAVYKRNLPDANDEFAKSLGTDNFNHLKEQIHHNLEHEEHHKEEERIEIEIFEALIKQAEFGELPDVLIDAETKKMTQEMESNILKQGIGFEDYLKHLNKTRNQLKLDFVPQAIKRVKGALLTRSIFLQEKMTVAESEIDQEIEYEKSLNQGSSKIPEYLDSKEYREYLRNVIGNGKVVDYLKTLCVERTNPEHKC